MPSCPRSTHCNFASGALLSSLIIAFGCVVVQWCWLGKGVWEGREKGTIQRVPHGMGTEGRVQGNVGIKESGDWGLHPKWRTIDQDLQLCRLLGSSTAVGDGSRRDFGREVVLGLVGTCHQVALNPRDPALLSGRRR